jgi:hydrogenase nickel incorporation protein HypA/HybF
VHELSISSAIVNTAERHAARRQVTAVDVRVGSLRQVVPDSLAFYFEIVARDTLCEGARLELERVAALLRCADCGRQWDPAPPPLATHEPLGPDGVVPPVPSFACPDCGTPGEVLAGDELEVESIEVEDAPAGAPAS